MHRRTYLAALGTAATGALAGCAALPGTDDPPAGSLRFSNAHTLPHTVGLRVTDVGSGPGDAPGDVTGDVTVPPSQRDLSTTANVSPDETATFAGAFTEPVWYGVAFTVDGRRLPDRGRVTFHPAPPGRDYVNYLSAEIRDSGEFTWAVVTTDDAGRFTPDSG